MKMTKHLVSVGLALVMLFTCLSVAFATDVPIPEDTAISATEPRINWLGSVNLLHNMWSTVFTDNNLINAIVTIKSDKGNPGLAKFRIIGGNGQLIGEVITVAPGESIKTSVIPYNSGTYKIQAIAVDVLGKYYFDIHD